MKRAMNIRSYFPEICVISYIGKNIFGHDGEKSCAYQHIFLFPLQSQIIHITSNSIFFSEILFKNNQIHDEFIKFVTTNHSSNLLFHCLKNLSFNFTLWDFGLGGRNRILSSVEKRICHWSRGSRYHIKKIYKREIEMTSFNVLIFSMYYIMKTMLSIYIRVS